MSADQPTTGGTPRGLEHLILPPKLDNIALMEWLEQSRHFMYHAGLILAADAAAVNAKLGKAKGFPVIGGMTQRYRAGKVSTPIGNAAGACTAAVQYLQHAGNQFEAVFMPELEQVGYKPAVSDFQWRAR